MKKKVRKVFKALSKKGLTQAFVEIDGNEYLYPGAAKSNHLVKKGFFLVLGLVILIAAGVFIYNNLLKPRSNVPTIDGKPLEAVDRYGMTPLHRAVIDSGINRVQRLVTLGAAVDAQDNYGWTPLHWAVFIKDAQICRYLLGQGAMPTIKTNGKWFKYPAGITAVQMAEIIKNPTVSAALTSKN